MPEKEKKEQAKPIPIRTKDVYKLANRFIKDLDRATLAVSPVLALEITNHLLIVLDFLARFAPDRSEEIYSAYAAAEEAFVRKWGILLKPYRQQQFHLYFGFDQVFAHKDVYSPEAYNELEEQSISEAEVRRFINIAQRVLGNCRDSFLELQPPSDEALAILAKDKSQPVNPALGMVGQAVNAGINKTATQDEESESAGKDFTKARRLLAVYFLLKAAGLETSNTPKTAKIVFIHLLFGEKFTSLPNSGIYEKYMKMPHFKRGKNLLSDLEFIRPYFEALEFLPALQLIDEQLAQLNT